MIKQLKPNPVKLEESQNIKAYDQNEPVALLIQSLELQLNEKPDQINGEILLQTFQKCKQTLTNDLCKFIERITENLRNYKQNIDTVFSDIEKQILVQMPEKLDCLKEADNLFTNTKELNGNYQILKADISNVISLNQQRSSDQKMANESIQQSEKIDRLAGDIIAEIKRKNEYQQQSFQKQIQLFKTLNSNVELAISQLTPQSLRNSTKNQQESPTKLQLVEIEQKVQNNESEQTLDSPKKNNNQTDQQNHEVRLNNDQSPQKNDQSPQKNDQSPQKNDQSPQKNDLNAGEKSNYSIKQQSNQQEEHKQQEPSNQDHQYQQKPTNKIEAKQQEPANNVEPNQQQLNQNDQHFEQKVTKQALDIQQEHHKLEETQNQKENNEISYSKSQEQSPFKNNDEQIDPLDNQNGDNRISVKSQLSAQTPMKSSQFRVDNFSLQQSYQKSADPSQRIEKRNNYATKIIVSTDQKLICGCNDGQIRFYDIQSKKLENSIVHSNGNAITALCISNDNNWLVSGGTDKKIKVWNLKTLKLSMTKQGHYGKILSLMFSPNGKFLISSADDNILIVWEANTMTLEQMISFANSQVNAIVFSVDANKMIVADSQCSLSVFRTSDFKLTQKLTGHKDSVKDVCVSPDGKYLASAGADRIIQIWSFNQSSAEVYPYGTLKHHTDLINCLQFTSDSKFLASGSEDCKLCVWDVQALSLKKELPSKNASITSITLQQNNIINANGDGSYQCWNQELVNTWHIE